MIFCGLGFVFATAPDSMRTIAASVLLTFIAAAGWGCQANAERRERAQQAAALRAQVVATQQMVALQQRLGYVLDLYRHETGGLPASAAELGEFLATRFQPSWLEGYALTEFEIAPADKTSLLVSFTAAQGDQNLRATFAHSATPPEEYVVVYNDMPMANLAAATLLSHYTRRPATPANLRSEYLIAEYEGAQNALPPGLSLDGVRFVPIYPPRASEAEVAADAANGEPVSSESSEAPGAAAEAPDNGAAGG